MGIGGWALGIGGWELGGSGLFNGTLPESLTPNR